jgi:hypothetical protein
MWLGSGSMTAEDGSEASTVAGDKGAVAQWTVRPGLGRHGRTVGRDWFDLLFN